MDTENTDIKANLSAVFSSRALHQQWGVANKTPGAHSCDDERFIRDIQRLPRPAHDEIVRLSSIIRKDHIRSPEAQISWARRLFDWNMQEEALAFTHEALRNAVHDRRPAVIVSKAISCLERNGYLEFAREALQFALDIFPDDRFFATMHGQMLMNQHQYAEAADILRNLHDIHPDDAVLATMLGTSYANSHQLALGIATLEKVLPRNRNDAVLTGTLGNLYMDARRPQDAKDMLEASHEIDRYRLATLCDLGEVYIRISRPHDAQRMYEMAAKQAPKAFSTIRLACRVKLSLGQAKQAQEAARTGMDLYADSAFFPSVIGSALMMEGRLSEAASFLEKSLQKFPQSPECAYSLGNAYAASGNAARFHAFKKHIQPAHKATYLEARLEYKLGNMKKCQTLLTPLIQAGNTMPDNMLGLFMASLPDGHAFFETLRAVRGEQDFSSLMRHRDAWRNSPVPAATDEDSYQNDTLPRMADPRKNPQKRARGCQPG